MLLSIGILAFAEYLSDSANVLSDTFITSQAFINQEPENEVLNTFEEDGINVRVTKALGEKCERCWIFSEEVGKDAEHPTLCPRCAAALK